MTPFWMPAFAALGIATVVSATATCTPDKRIAGVKLGVNATVTGNEATIERLPFEKNATYYITVQGAALRLANDDAGSRNVIRLLHQVTTDINVVYTDNGTDTATANGTLQVGIPGLLGIANVASHTNAVFDEACLAYYTETFFDPLESVSLAPLLEYLSGKGVPVKGDVSEEG